MTQKPALKPNPIPNTAFPLIYIDKDHPRIARYERDGKKAVLTHAVEADLGEAQPLTEIDWKSVEAFRVAPPVEWAVVQPKQTEPTEPEVA